MNLFWIVLVLAYLVTSSGGFPVFGNFLQSKDDAETTSPVVIHHRHRKHHYRHKHRRSLASKEEAKVRRNKHLLLTKPYWPWP